MRVAKLPERIRLFNFIAVESTELTKRISESVNSGVNVIVNQGTVRWN